MVNKCVCGSMPELKAETYGWGDGVKTSFNYSCPDCHISGGWTGNRPDAVDRWNRTLEYHRRKQ